MDFVKITGTGSATPDKILSNYDLEKIVETSDEWITSRTGIKERRIADKDVASSDLGYEASIKAMEAASIDPSDIDGVIVGTITPDHFFPATSCIIQDRLSITNAFAFDVLAGCSGFLYALQAGKGIIDSGNAENILLVGTEVISKILDYEDRTTCILFGDGAGAAVISKSKTPGILSIKISADGSAGELLHMPGGGSRMPASEQSLKDRAHFLKMKGNDVFKVAVKMMESSTIEALEKAGISTEDIDLFIPHQANSRILEALRKRLGVPSDKIYSNLEKYGNTSSASVPIALDEAIRSGKAKKGDTILFSVFGAGFTWGSAVVKL